MGRFTLKDFLYWKTLSLGYACFLFFIIFFLGINQLFDGWIVEIYWSLIGRPLSLLTGSLVDRIPFSVSEILLEYALLSLIIWLCPLRWTQRYSLRRFAFPGLLLLPIMVFSQGITPIDWVPSAHRQKPFKRIILGQKVDPRSYSDFVLKNQVLLNKEFNIEQYNSTNETDLLKDIHRAVRKACESLKYTPGRTVKNIKAMSGISRLLGLSYGGPAYHDVITGEVVIVSEKDYPAPKFWRITAITHEIIHAQGFTREMDTEILTWLALRLSENPLLNNLSYLMVLHKSGQAFTYPKSIEQELKTKAKLRKEIQQKQTLINFLKNIQRTIQVQNSAKKYGSIQPGTPIPQNHEFFKSVYLLDEKIEDRKP